MQVLIRNGDRSRRTCQTGDRLSNAGLRVGFRGGRRTGSDLLARSDFPAPKARIRSKCDRMAPLTGRGGTPCLEPMRTPRGRTTCGDGQASRDRLRPAWSGSSGPTGGEPTSHAGFEPRVLVQSGLVPGPSMLGSPSRWRTRRGGRPVAFLEASIGRGPGIDLRLPQDGGMEASVARYRSATSSRLSGMTRTPATADMKLRSPDHRGTTWTCRCWGSPAPAASP